MLFGNFSPVTLLVCYCFLLFILTSYSFPPPFTFPLLFCPSQFLNIEEVTTCRYDAVVSTRQLCQNKAYRCASESDQSDCHMCTGHILTSLLIISQVKGESGTHHKLFCTRQFSKVCHLYNLHMYSSTYYHFKLPFSLYLLFISLSTLLYSPLSPLLFPLISGVPKSYLNMS